MNIGSLPKACVILGAGASHDVANTGSRTINGDWKPPLAKDLFDIEHNEHYSNILDPYGGARFLVNILAPKLAENMFSLEKELRRLADHNHPAIKQKFKYIPP